MIFYVLVSLVLLTYPSYEANILGVMPWPSFSHQIAFSHMWKELSLRGHHVTLITSDPLNDPSLTNLTEIDAKWSYQLMQDFSGTMKMWNIHKVSNKYMLKIADAILSHPEVQHLIHNRTFDVVMAEFTSPVFLALGETYSCPTILLATLDVTAVLHQAFGNPISPVIYPDLGATFYGTLSFKERVISTLYTWYNNYYLTNYVFTSNDVLAKKHFGTSKTVYEMISETDLMFINVNPILQPIRALGPSTITVGGKRPTIFQAPLSKDVAEFLDNAKDGFVYFSLGSNVKSKNLDKSSLEFIRDALGELPYKVLWKFETEELPNKPNNIKLIKWAPQQTILSHRNIKVFVTQGGLQSMEEGIFNGVPFVVIPFIADQEYNAKVMESKGIAIRVNRKPYISKEELRNAIMEVIRDPKYRVAVKKLKALASDFPMTGLEKAVWWTEYVIRNKGAKHLRNPAADIPSYQYYLIDVISFIVLCSALILALVYLLLKHVYRCLIHILYTCKYVCNTVMSDKKVR